MARCVWVLPPRPTVVRIISCGRRQVVACLAADDFGSASDGCEAALARGDGFAGSEEAAAAEDLLAACNGSAAEPGTVPAIADRRPSQGSGLPDSADRPRGPTEPAWCITEVHH